jgi:hypothetical protein
MSQPSDNQPNGNQPLQNPQPSQHQDPIEVFRHPNGIVYASAGPNGPWIPQNQVLGGPPVSVQPSHSVASTNLLIGSIPSTGNVVFRTAVFNSH